MIDQRALAVKRIDCRLSLQDLNRGSAILGPLRVPFSEAKKLEYAVSRSRSDCWSTTADASASHARAPDFFASVMTCLDNSPILGYGPPCS